MTGGKAATEYVARYGWNRRSLGVLAGCAGFCAAVLLVPDMPTALMAVTLGFFGSGALFTVIVASSRKVAFRVDETGVLLGGTPLRYTATTAHVPWEDIEALVLWRQRLPHHQTMPYVGLARREGAPVLPGPGQGPKARALAGFVAPDVPLDVLMASRAVNGWRLDKERLTAAVTAFAPDVRIVDAW